MSKDNYSKLPNSLLNKENYVKKTADLYNKIAEWYVKSFWNDETDSDWIKLCLSAIEGKKTVADIGSGPGNYSRIFSDNGYKVTCTDISFEMIRRAISLIPNVYGIVSDMRNMPFNNNSYDCVFCAYSINHILKEDFVNTLRELTRILKISGIFCLLLKIGSTTYEFSSTGHPGTCSIMYLVKPEEILDSIQILKIKPTIIRYKDETSKREFQHKKMLIIGSKSNPLAETKT